MDKSGRILWRSLALSVLIVFACAGSVAGAQAAPAATGDQEGCPAAGKDAQTIRGKDVCISADSSGAYRIAGESIGAVLSGRLPSAARLRVRTGTDPLGAYSEIVAEYGAAGRSAAFRVYRERSAVLLLDQFGGKERNRDPFPEFRLAGDWIPASYKVFRFAPVDFGNLDSQGPWLFFDRANHAIVISPADHFLVSDMEKGSDGVLSSGIDQQISTFPAGFQHGTIVAFGSGIRNTLAAWGKVLQDQHQKKPIPNDADVVLNQFGYWTDNGAYYYYKYEPHLGYEGTLLAVRDEYRKLGVPLAYLQLDSWWYPKPKGNNPEGDNGETVYRADAEIFPKGLDDFYRRLGLPMAVHARWVAESSPYRKQYEMSRNVIIDPRFWNSTADYLAKGGVAVYEQDWLDHNARPAIDLEQPREFLAQMSRGMAGRGISIQYCMALPAYFMASAQFQNVRTIRVSDDRFERSRWDEFLYTSALAHAVGLWPWSDVFMSTELPNLVLSTLSAGPVGTGDALGSVAAVNLRRAMRADSVLLKPDTPLQPIDSMYLKDAAAAAGSEASGEMIAETSSDFGSATEHYVFAYARNMKHAATEVPLEDLGISSAVYAWDWQRGEGKRIEAGGRLKLRDSNGWSYAVLAPVSERGIALIGDASKIVPLARKRFSSVVSTGNAVDAKLIFAAGETSVTVSGYSAAKPTVQAIAGKAANLRYDSKTHLFSVEVLPGAGNRAEIHIS